MNDKQFLAEMVRRGSVAEKGYFEYAHIVACELPKHLRESLACFVDGPVWDGDVPSKEHRSALFELGLLVRVCVRGQQGYTGATYFAYAVNRRLQDIKTGKIGA